LSIDENRKSKNENRNSKFENRNSKLEIRNSPRTLLQPHRREFRFSNFDFPAYSQKALPQLIPVVRHSQRKRRSPVILSEAKNPCI